jgi:hypothetical protein
MSYLSDVPLATEVDQEMTDELEDELVPEEEGEGEFRFGDSDATGRGGRGGRGEFGGEFGGRGGGFGGMRGGGFGRGGRGGGEFGGGEFGGGEYGGEFGGRGGGGGGGGSLGLAGDSMKFDAETGELEVEVPFLMLRFFDLTVQPGKRYKYRTQLILADPNYAQSREALDNTVLARERKSYILGEWSDASPTISIPQAAIVRVAESSPPREGYYSEPAATMLVQSFGLDERGNAMQASTEIEGVRRGSVMNFTGDVETLVDQGRYIETIEDFTIDTGVVVLDLDGGTTYSRDQKEPTHALLMDASGRMYLRDELDDEVEVAIHRAVFEESDQPAGRGFDGGRGGGGEFGGEFGF